MQRARTASAMDQVWLGARSWQGACAKKQTRRPHAPPSVQSCVRYLLGCRLRSYTPCA
jgi:hypothetical protein